MNNNSEITKFFSKFALVCAFFLCVFASKPIVGATNEQITLRIWDFPRWLEPPETTNRFAFITRKIKEFEAMHPNVKIKLTKLTWNRGGEKLKIAAISGDYPDIAPGTIPLLFIKEGLIEPINSYLTPEDKNDYFASALKAFSKDGKIYGWPWYMSGQLLYLNNALFKEANVALPKNGRWSPKEFTEKMRAIKDFFASNPKYKHHRALGLYFQKNETANLPFLSAFGGRLIDENGVFCGTKSNYIKGISWVKALISAGIAAPDSGGKTANDTWAAFAADHRLAAAAFGLWGVAALEGRFATNFSIAAFPAEKGADNGAYIGTSGFYVFKSNDKKKLKAAMSFARFLTNGANQKALSLYSQFPTRKSAGNIYPTNAHMSMALEVFKTGQSVFNDCRWVQTDEEFSALIQQTLLNRVSPKNAMEALKNKFARIMSVNTASIHEEITKSGILSKVLICLAAAALAFALLSRQTHLIMVVPAVGIIGLFLFYPLSDAVLLAFRSYKIGEVGSYTLNNFIQCFSDEKFLTACKNTLLYAAVVVPANVFCALIAASLIYSLKGKTKAFFRAGYYLPGVASVVVLSMIWRRLLDSETGLFNSVLRYFSISSVGFLTNPDIAFWSVILAGILHSPGGPMLIYLASMGNIPQSLYESAELEGAGTLKKWWYITVPMLRGTTTFLMITGAISALQVFAQVMMLTDGGPGISTQVIVYRVYTAAFRDFNFGLSSAMALVLFAAIMIITLIQRRYAPAEIEYSA